jgi:hypothetical protein
MLICRFAFAHQVAPVTAPVRYPITNPPINNYKRKPQSDTYNDVKVFRKLANITSSKDALQLRRQNQNTVDKTPWLKAAFWTRLAELNYLEN